MEEENKIAHIVRQAVKEDWCVKPDELQEMLEREGIEVSLGTARRLIEYQQFLFDVNGA